MLIEREHVIIAGEVAYIRFKTKPRAVRQLECDILISACKLPMVLGKMIHLHTGRNTLYAILTIGGKRIRMHRYLMGVDEKHIIDHADRNGLNNTDGNLSVCNMIKNAQNRDTDKRNKSGVLGVWWDKSRNKWCAKIRANGVNYGLGRHETFKQAVKARKEAEKKYFGTS